MRKDAGLRVDAALAPRGVPVIGDMTMQMRSLRAPNMEDAGVHILGSHTGTNSAVHSCLGNLPSIGRLPWEGVGRVVMMESECFVCRIVQICAV